VLSCLGSLEATILSALCWYFTHLTNSTPHGDTPVVLIDQITQGSPGYWRVTTVGPNESMQPEAFTERQKHQGTNLYPLFILAPISSEYPRLSNKQSHRATTLHPHTKNRPTYLELAVNGKLKLNPGISAVKKQAEKSAEIPSEDTSEGGVGKMELTPKDYSWTFETGEYAKYVFDSCLVLIK